MRNVKFYEIRENKAFKVKEGIQRWTSNTSEISWGTAGIHNDLKESEIKQCCLAPKNIKSEEINKLFLATGDNFGLINMFRYPCRPGNKAKSYRVHGESIKQLIFGINGEYLYTISGFERIIVR